MEKKVMHLPLFGSARAEPDGSELEFPPIHRQDNLILGKVRQ